MQEFLPAKGILIKNDVTEEVFYNEIINHETMSACIKVLYTLRDIVLVSLVS